jgi:uncharacterized protein YuzE
MKSGGGKTFCLIFLSILFVAAGFFICPNFALASSNLVVSEIMYDPEGNDTSHSDWIEIYNAGDSKVEIDKNEFGIIDEKSLELGSDGIHYKNCHKIEANLEIDSKKFIIITSDKEDFENDYSGVSVKILDSAFSLSSAGDQVRLSEDKCKTFFTDFEFESSWGGKDNGKTLEKVNYNNEYAKINWQESYVIGGTPGEKNSEKPEPKTYSNKIRINEILPNPSGDETKNEFVEIFNFSDKEEDLSGWEIKDSSFGGSYEFPSGTKIKSKEYLVFYRSDFDFALNNSGEKIFLLNPEGKEVDAVSYGTAKESVSYNFDEINWHWSKYLTPAEENKLDSLPVVEIKKDQKIYKNIYANFEAIINNSKNSEAKISWDFGDGHKSYLQKTKHKYLKTGKYSVSLKVRGESEDYVENFEVEVEKFGGTKIKIVKIKANPKGKDDKETITLKNTSKKKINLKGWSIATGWKNLYNHPINKKLVLKPGETKEITKKYSAFTLNNKQTKIELRYPDGTVAAKVKYSKKDGIQDDEIFEKGENGWEWEMRTDADLTQTNAGLQSDVENNVKSEDEILEENADDNKSNQAEDSLEIQEDEPMENQEQGEVLGLEIIREDKIANNSGIFQRMFWNINQKANSAINFFSKFF